MHHCLFKHSDIEVYIVVGGYRGSSGSLDSTEILVHGSNSWKKIASFPVKVENLRTVNIDNTILSFGKFSTYVYMHYNI